MCLQYLLYKCKHVKIDDGCRNGNERRVETVEHSAMTGQNVSAVFDAECALEKRLNKVAPRTEHHHYKA